MESRYSQVIFYEFPDKLLDRITPETLKVIKKARVILDLTSSLRLLKRFCKNVVDLDPDYWTGEEDAIVYKRIANKVLDQARTGPRVVLVVDGHPGIYQDLSWDIYDRGRPTTRVKGYNSAGNILPGFDDRILQSKS